MTQVPASSPGLSRRLSVFDAVVIGLGSMIGAGVFAAFAPASQAAGAGLLIGLASALERGGRCRYPAGWPGCWPGHWR